MKIAVNAGHCRSGSGTGAEYKGFNEAVIAREVAAALIPKLKRRGHTVVSATVDKASSQNAYLREVCDRVNASGAELFISLHCNASLLHQGKGVECYTWQGKKNATASKICANMAKLGLKNRGIKDGSKLYVIKHTKPTAILVELFFLDNYTDRKVYLEQGAAKIADAIAKSL